MSSLEGVVHGPLRLLPRPDARPSTVPRRTVRGWLGDLARRAILTAVWRLG